MANSPDGVREREGVPFIRYSAFGVIPASVFGSLKFVTLSNRPGKRFTARESAELPSRDGTGERILNGSGQWRSSLVPYNCEAQNVRRE